MPNVSPRITALYAVPLPTKRRALMVSQSQKATVEFQFLDDVGNPVDLAELVGPQGPQDVEAAVRIREVLSTKNRDLFEVGCTIEDAATGMVSFRLPAGVTKNSGVYTAEIAALDADESLLASNKCYIWVDRGLFGDPRYPNFGAPTVDEVRLYIRDNAPEENRLLDDFEFDLAEICHSAELAVRYWNESQPPIGVCFNTNNYPVRDRWLQYIAGHMFQVAAHRFRRNHLPYQAGGLSIDDQNKFQQYDQAGMMMVQDYKEWVKQKKVSINLQMAITSSGSPYGATAYTLLNTGI